VKYTKRGIFRLTAFLTTGIFLAVVAGSIWVYSSQLPTPENADREELLQWLVTRDLSGESAHTRAVLARRLGSEFVNVDWGGLNGRMTGEYRRRLWQNLPLLLEPWFLDKLAAYNGRAESQRPAYIDGIIDRMVDLSGIDCLRESGASGNAPGLMQLFLERVEIIKKQSPAEKRQQIGDFTAAIQTRWLLRAFSAERSNKSLPLKTGTNTD
jgi:hypothetical protein